MEMQQYMPVNGAKIYFEQLHILLKT